MNQKNKMSTVLADLTVELQVFLRPARAMRNKPPQRGGEQSLPNNRPERATQSGLALPFQGEIYEEASTHRVAVGCYALPLKGRKKNLQSYWQI
jgi:hypothetical protein